MTHAIFLVGYALIACLSTLRSAAQSTSEDTDAIRGVVINRLTHEPIARALVYSPDNRFATMTNSEGRFEFILPKTDSASEGGQDSNPSTGQIQSTAFNRPYTLTARKPGYMPDPDNRGQNLQDAAAKDLTLTLTPESLIVGTVTLPSSEPPDNITLQIFRRQVQDGRARWVPASGSQSTSEGEFRFADLPAGTYKLLTHEQLDHDPLTVDSITIDPITHARRAPLLGYPPVYYQNASDFGSAATIQLGAGQTQTVSMTLVKQPYYRVKVPVIPPPENGVRVSVYSLGRKGPGFSLGYNGNNHAIEGFLPSGTYTLEVSSYGPNGVSGVQSITIRGAPVEGPSMMLTPNTSIPVILKTEFTGTDQNVTSTWNINGRNVALKGLRRYLANVTLEPVDDMEMRGGASLRDPTRSDDDTLFIDGVAPGTYWLQAHPALGYVASVRSGNLDLLHQPLVVAAGGAVSPIEISIRDDVAEISGTIEGIPSSSPAQASASGDARGWTSYTPSGGQAGAHLYCIPTSDGNGQFMQIWVGPNGSFSYSGLAPGTYRLLAFHLEPPEFEYRNPEAMRAYDSKGVVIRLVGGQKERVQLQLISTSSSENE